MAGDYNETAVLVAGEDYAACGAGSRPVAGSFAIITARLNQKYRDKINRMEIIGPVPFDFFVPFDFLEAHPRTTLCPRGRGFVRRRASQKTSIQGTQGSMRENESWVNPCC
jgi:hypothetical protein